MKLRDRVAVIAGGAQGIGEACVKCFAEEGADVAILDKEGDIAAKLAEEVKTAGRRALAIKADLTDEDEVKRSITKSVDFFGRIDILVNSVGGRALNHDIIAQRRREKREAGEDPILDFMIYDIPAWDRYYRLNLRSHVMLCQAVTPHFIKQRSGKIVNISSAAGRVPEPNHMPYGAMKAGDISLTWSLARALAPYDVNVNCICPGYVYTPLWERNATQLHEAARRLRAEGKATLKGFAAEDVENLTPYEVWLKRVVVPNTPMRREQTAEDMARAALFFVSDDAKNVTGQTLQVDGGMNMR